MFYVTGLVILQVVVFDFNLFYFLFGFDPPVGSLLILFYFNFLFGFDPPVGSLLILFYFIFGLRSIPQLDHFCFCLFIITPLGLYMGVGWVGWKREKKLPAPARISG